MRESFDEHDPSCQALLLHAKLPEQGYHGGLHGSTRQKLLRETWAAFLQTCPQVARHWQQLTDGCPATGALRRTGRRRRAGRCQRRPRRGARRQVGTALTCKAHLVLHSAAPPVEVKQEGTPCPPLCCPIDSDEADTRIKKGSLEGHGAGCHDKRAVSRTTKHL